VEERNIVITGTGAVTPLGTGTAAFWEGLISGRCGIGEIDRFDASALPIRWAGEVRGFNPKDYMPNPLVLDTAPFARYAIAAAVMAVEESGLDTDSDRVGVVMGTALHGMDYLTHAQQIQDETGKGGDPKLMTKYMGNMAAAQFAIRRGIRGPSLTVGTACSSGGDAVTMGALLVKSGMADAVVVMAGEGAICPPAILSLHKSRALSLLGESRPFSADRSGFVLGEGGGALVLETEAHAEKRCGRVLARLLGWGNNTDAYHPVSPRPDGAQAAACMRLALREAHLRPEDIGYINAHGTATRKGDEAEASAIRAVFGAEIPPVSSTKGATGHMMGAGGITELIACVKALETGLLPPNLGFTAADEACPLPLVTELGRVTKLKAAMSNAFGFGGQNSSLIVGRAE
jgi:3-oxoacyl-[acyl-carrier-protein] synthase II